MASHFDEKSGVVYADTAWGRWYQTLQEVVVEVAVAEGTRGKDVSVDLRASFVKCAVAGKTLFAGTPYAVISTDESTWTIEDRKLLRIQLVKASKDKDKACWAALLAKTEEDFAPNPIVMHEMKKKLDLEAFQIENPGFDFSGAKLDKRYDDEHLRSLQTKSDYAS